MAAARLHSSAAVFFWKMVGITEAGVRSNVWAFLVATLSSVAIAQTTPEGAAQGAADPADATVGAPATPAAQAPEAAAAAEAAPTADAATDEALPPPPGATTTDDTLAAAPSVDASPELAGPDQGLAPQAVTARGPTQGRPLVVRRGFFVDTNLGTFFTVGGNDLYSNAQSYVQLGVGYDLFEFLEVGAHVAFGSNAFNCFAGRLGQDGSCRRSDAFTVTFFDASVAYLFKISDRLYLTPKVVGGWTLLDPEPIEGRTRGINIGAGVGVEYATAMDHFSVGAELLGRYVLGANIPTFAIFPRVKYTF